MTVHYYSARYPDAALRFKVTYDREVAKYCMEVMYKLWKLLAKYAK